MAVTIKDVAHHAGVSTATVSHVINNSRFVAGETREKVESAIRKLGYVANINARGLRRSVSQRIGLIVPEVSDYFPVDIIEPIEKVLKKAGYQLILGYTHDDIEMERRQVEFFNYQQIDGLLLFPAIGNHSYLAKMRADCPIVLLDRVADDLDADCVRADDETAIHEAVSFLVASGHRSIGVLFGDRRISTSRHRHRAFVRALLEHGIEADPGLVREGDMDHETGYRLAGELLDTGRITALLATNIPLTIGAFKCLLERGVRVPRDVAMLGWGDSRWTDLTNPPLTVLRHPNQAMGNMAAKILLRRLRKPGGAFREYLLPVEIVRRGSV